MKLMVRHPNAPIEPPHKFLGHGVCETRSKSKAIEGRPLGETVAERGGEDERKEEGATEGDGNRAVAEAQRRVEVQGE